MADVSAQPLIVSSTPLRIAESVRAHEGGVLRLDDFHRWFRSFGRRGAYAHVERIRLADLAEWSQDPETGIIRHRSGRFFTVEGLDVHIPGAPVARWSQPIINQPEIGILGILVREFDGVLHCLMQAKVEPGNCNGLQVSPTVQATLSNYTRVHRGRSVPYLAYFRDTSRHRIITDVRQSEQGSAFHHKRNRNMIVETSEDVQLMDGFCWLTLGQIHRLLTVDNLVNMDARTVLACLPFAHTGLTAASAAGGDDFLSALTRSCDPAEGSLHSMEEILSWITGARTRTEIRTAIVPLMGLPGWRRGDATISHETGRFFDVIAVNVEAGGREIGGWTQPMIEPYGSGIVAFLVREIGGVLHALVHARAEPGYVDVIELAPTVQCTPANYEHLPETARPRFLDLVLSAAPEQIRYEVILSEEGGRFFHARNRYLIVETDVDVWLDHPDFRWMTLHQLVDLLRHSYYVNVQARSLVACMHSLFAT